jgi:mannose/fructose/N-acetylgalactosamine-specific phosphotransferase system component IIC
MHCFDIPNSVIDPYNVTELDYYALDPINEICGFGFLLSEFAAASLIIWLTKGRLPNFMLKMSKNVTHIYVAQWFLIGLLVGVIDKIPNIWLSMLLSAAVLGAAFAYAMFRERLSKKKAAKTD